MEILKKFFIKFERFIKFSIVGLSGIIVNWGIYIPLTRFFKLEPAISYLFSVELSIVSNFILNDLWTFKDRKNNKFNPWYKRFFKFQIVSITALLFNWGIFYFFTYKLNIYDLLSSAIGIAVGTLINYFSNLFWTWSK